VEETIMFDFSSKVVIVTGAAGNLGAAVAFKYHKAGARLVLVDRNEQSLKDLYPQLLGLPDHLMISGLNLADPQDVDRMAAQVNQHYGRMDVLVNTVGGYRAGTPLHETPIETLDFMFNLNVRTVFLVSKAVIPCMLANGYGKIVSIAARPGIAGRDKMAAYSAAKSAVIRLTESMAAELKPAGINVNCVIPGTIDTPQNRQDSPHADFSLWVQPDSLADVILFLTSDAARDVHGAALPVYGRS
jgi:NAD(P)-dependent dehydrogenase (short-subunit alcohol dehydrogenase family)